MILMLAPAANMAFGAAPSGAGYVSDQFSLLRLSNDSPDDQAYLQGAGCFTLSPFGGWGTYGFNMLNDLYAADTGSIFPGFTGYPQHTVASIFDDGNNVGLWTKTGFGNGPGSWTQVTTSLAPDINVALAQTAAKNAAASAALALTAGSAGNPYPNAAATYLPQGVAAWSLTSAGSGGANGTNILATYSGGTLTYNPVIRFDIVGGAVTNVRVVAPGLYIGTGTPTMPTISLPGSAGGAALTLTAGPLIGNGASYWVQSADATQLLQYGNNSGSPATYPFGATQSVLYTSAGVSAAIATANIDSLLLYANAIVATNNYPHVVYGIKATPQGQTFGVSQPSPALPRLYSRLLGGASLIPPVGYNGPPPQYSRMLVPNPAQVAPRRLLQLSDGLSGQKLMVSDGSAWRDPATGNLLIKYDPSNVIYVSSVAVNNIPIGNDSTGTGSAAAPYLTIDKAMTVAVNGKVILFNGVASSPTVYATSSAFLNVTKGVTIDSVVPYGASIGCAGGNTRVVSVTLSSAVTAVFGQVIIDGAGLYQGITVSTTGSLFGLQIIGTRIVNFKDAGVMFTAGGALVNFVVQNAYFENDPSALGTSLVDGAIYIYQAGSGSTVTISDSTFRMTNHAGGGQAAIRLRGGVAGQSFSLARNDIQMSIKTGLAGSAVHYGILIEDAAANLTFNSTRLSGGDGSHSGVCVCVTPNTTASPLSTGGSIITDNLAYNDCIAGMLYQNGTDAQGTVADGHVGTITFSRNVGFGTARSQAGGLHGVLIGGGGTILATGNYMETTGDCWVDKVGSSCLWAGNVSVDASIAHFRLKGGSGGKFINNTAIERGVTPYGGAMALVLANDIPSTTPTTSYTIKGNNFYAPSMTSNGLFLTVGPTDVVTPSYNNYFGGAGASNPFSWQGTAYANFASYKAARESNALSVDPIFTDANGDNYQPKAASPLRGAVALDPSYTADFLGNIPNSPATIGAFKAAA